MKAGATDLEVGTRVRITHIADGEARDLIGVEGELTHPFPGLMWPGVRYVAGLRHGEGDALRANLCPGDRFEVIAD